MCFSVINGIKDVNFWITFCRERSMAMVVERTLNLDLNSNVHFMVGAAF